MVVDSTALSGGIDRDDFLSRQPDRMLWRGLSPSMTLFLPYQGHEQNHPSCTAEVVDERMCQCSRSMPRQGDNSPCEFVVRCGMYPLLGSPKILGYRHSCRLGGLFSFREDRESVRQTWYQKGQGEQGVLRTADHIPPLHRGEIRRISCVLRLWRRMLAVPPAQAGGFLVLHCPVLYS